MRRFTTDPDPDAYRKEIDRLLRDPRYGERWGRHWLDIARYADTDGGYDGPLPHIWRYRDYVVRAFNQDRPFDRFIREQIAGDSYAHYGQGRQAGSRIPAWHGLQRGRRAARRPQRYRQHHRFGLSGTDSGLRRCHDHKYDPIPIVTTTGWRPSSHRSSSAPWKSLQPVRAARPGPQGLGRRQGPLGRSARAPEEVPRKNHGQVQGTAGKRPASCRHFRISRNCLLEQQSRERRPQGGQPSKASS